MKLRSLTTLVLSGLVAFTTGCKTKNNSKSSAPTTPSQNSAPTTPAGPAPTATPTNLKEWQKRFEFQKDCQFVSAEVYSINPNATNLYRSTEQNKLSGIYDLKEASNAIYQCANEKVGVFLYEFVDESEARTADGFIQGFIWGEAKQPTPAAPDRIYLKGKMIILLSSKDSSALDALLKQ